MVEEIVTLYDDAGLPCGEAPRSRVRAQNLRHGATAVLVTNSAGEIHVHRRTATKDVYPDLYDFAAGGVLAAGEDPDDGARRELAEELGITGVPLVRVGETDYADEHTTYRAFLYRVRWDGVVRMQPQELSWGDWVPLDQLRRRVAQRPDLFVPDSVALWRDRPEFGSEPAR